MVLHCHLVADLRNSAHSGSDYWCMLFGHVHVSGSLCSYSLHPFFFFVFAFTSFVWLALY